MGISLGLYFCLYVLAVLADKDSMYVARVQNNLVVFYVVQKLGPSYSPAIEV